MSRRPAISVEARENQLISASIDLVERQIEDGTVSASVLTHYIKLGSSKERLEREKLERENELLKARVEALERSQRSDEMYERVLSAFRSYSGYDDEYYEDDYDCYEDDYDD